MICCWLDVIWSLRLTKRRIKAVRNFLGLNRNFRNSSGDLSFTGNLYEDESFKREDLLVQVDQHLTGCQDHQGELHACLLHCQVCMLRTCLPPKILTVLCWRVFLLRSWKPYSTVTGTTRILKKRVERAWMDSKLTSKLRTCINYASKALSRLWALMQPCPLPSLSARN